MCEIGNFSIHLTLSNLKADGKVLIFILLISVFKFCVKARELRELYSQYMLYLHVTNSQEPGAEGFLSQLKTPSHGCLSLCHVQIIHMR